MELAEVVVEAEVFPSVLLHLAHRCPQVRKNAAALVRDVVKHSVDLALYVVNMGGIGALIEALGQGGTDANSCVIPCITALGYVAGKVFGPSGRMYLNQSVIDYAFFKQSKEF